jgi:hypothetical protein
MKKEQLNKILEKARFTLVDTQYKELSYLLGADSFKRARLYLEELIEEKEIDFALSNYDSVEEYELQSLNDIQDLIIDLIVNEMDNVEGKQFRKIIKG